MVSAKQTVRDVKLDYHFAVKENLARLLAEEAVDVRIDGVTTASFDMKNRVLTVPMWTGISNYLYDMLIVHEVGHARYTPGQGWIDSITELGKHIVSEYSKKFPKASPISQAAAEKTASYYINVTEDARIDRMQRDKFPGSKKDYAIGSKELLSREFFGKQIDFVKLSFADRLNVYTKCTVHVPEIKFTDEEKTVVDEVMSNNTFEEAVVSARKVIDLQIDESMKNAEANQRALDAQKFLSDLTINTMKELADKLSKMAGEGQKGVSKPKNVKISNVDKYDSMSGVVVSVDDYLRHVSVVVNPTDSDSHVGKTHAKYKDYISGAVNRFDVYKAAADYLGRTEKTTGVLDTQRIHAYKHSDDIFYKSVIERKAKNHSIVIMLDLSSSMAEYFHNVIEQTYAIVKFCRQTRIPYEVYMFSNGVNNSRHSGRVVKSPFSAVEVSRPGSSTPDVKEPEMFSLVNIFSHKHTYKKEMVSFNKMLLAASNNRGHVYGMNGTPLDVSILSTDVLVKKILSDTRTEIPTVVFITDGDSNPYIGMYWSSSNLFLKDSFDGKIYSIDTSKTPQTVVYLEMLKNRTGANLINYFLCDPRTNSGTVSRYIKGEFSTSKKFQSYDGKGFDKVHVFNVKEMSGNIGKKVSMEMADAFARHIAEVIKK